MLQAQGEEVHQLGFILEGSARLVGEEGREAVVGPHEFFGAECLGSQQLSLWSVVADGPLTYLSWDRLEMLQELENRDVAFVVTTLLNVDAERKVHLSFLALTLARRPGLPGRSTTGQAGVEAGEGEPTPPLRHLRE